MIVRRGRVSAVASIALLLAIVGCGGPEPVAPSLDLGGTWTVTTVGERVPVDLSEPRIQFTESGEIRGSTGCNDFRGQVDIEDGRMRIGRLIQTDMGCLGPVGDLEAAFLRALTAADRISVTDGVLIQNGPGGEIRAER
jgi:heat shock protein HslJ